MDEKIKEIKPIFENVIALYKEYGLYGDCNYIKKSDKRTIVTKNDTIVDSDRDCGVKLRVWDGNSYQEFGTSSLEKYEIIEGAKKLCEKAQKTYNSLKKPLSLDVDTSMDEDEFLREVAIEISAKDKIEELSQIKDEILSARENVVNAKVGAIQQEEHHLFMNEYKTLYQEIPICIYVNIANVSCEDGTIRNAFSAYTNSTFEEALEKGKQNLQSFFEKIDNMNKAKRLKGGKYNVVLSPKLSGLLAHESFGHGMEADTMMKQRALANEWIGKKIGNENVSIIDYSAIKGKNGEFHFDHEGNKAKKTYLVNKGVIETPMADIYSKTRQKLTQSNNARFESFDHKHYTRMSNTYFEPGETPLTQLISSIEDGILITDSSGGMEDPKGWGVQIQGNFGQRIKNGKLVDEFYDGFTLTGFLPDIISNIDGVSKEFEIDGAGMCGKGHKEWVRVSEGGPYLSVKDVMLG